MVNGYKIEICIGNITDGLNAAKYPIDRLEVNSAMELSGLTPSLEMIKELKRQTDIPLCCMCRIRGGDFCYDENEYKVMFADCKNMLEAKADGIVFGFLNADKTINVEKTRQMVELIHSYGKQAIFHKAFDELSNLEEGLKQLIDLKVDRVLTNGSEDDNLIEGCKRLAPLVKKYSDQIEILPGGGLRVENVQEVINITGCKQIHTTSKKLSEKGFNQFDGKQLEQFIEKINEL